MFHVEIACHGKQPMERKIATSVAERMRGRRKSRRKRHGTNQAYKCRVCGSWHVGRPSERNRGALWRPAREVGDELLGGW